MMIEDLPFINELDAEQKAAAITEKDAVVSAGAGSGKTRVLCARYLWLIMTGKCKVDQILTITFTNKAANEMYRRIYSLLSDHAGDNEHARKAIDNFCRARISTLDSFCLGIARTVSRRFGISPDFESNETRLKEQARSLALRFVLDKRNDPALQTLIAEKKMRETAEELFANPVLKHGTVSSPLDFKHFEKIQREELLKNWKYLSREADEQIKLTEELYKEIPEKLALYQQLSGAFLKKAKAPDLEGFFTEKENTGAYRESIVSYLDFLNSLAKCSSNPGKNEAARAAKDAMQVIKKIHGFILALAGSIFQWDIVQGVFPLIAEYQELLNKEKRKSGIISFNDISRMAVDGLRMYEDLRRMYRNSFRMIMIDEFQDNNSLQRDLVDLLAGPAGVFYVGDEKQSIYRFRGADVSVFRSLSDRAESALSLDRNYRSYPALIRAFNLIFGGYKSKDDPAPEPAVFSPHGTKTESYKATYRWIDSKEDSKKIALESENNSHLHFAFFDAGLLTGDDYLKGEDYEAAYIAAAIRDLHDRGTKVYNKEKEKFQNCAYSDFAVLLRSHTHQHSLEKALKLYGIPYNADRPASLFSDAPVNDLLAYLKLLVYPGDRIAYGALLRSPFVRLSEDGFSLCMLKGERIFDEALDEILPAQDRLRYREGRRRYRELLSLAQNLPVSALITNLWYKEGYRHEALWSASTQVYLDLYDLFHEQARIVEDRGGSLVDFIDYMEAEINKEEKPDDSVLSGEEENGVRIMTIHRSKGLEFPFVFVYNCGSIEKTSLGTGLALYSDQWGIFLRLPRPEELPDAGDYFCLAEGEEHRSKTEAELRRLLYVAMTRAEHSVYITGTIPRQNQTEQEEFSMEECGGYGKQYIIKRFEQYKNKQNISSINFLRLLPVLNDDNPLYTITAIDTNVHNSSTEFAVGREKKSGLLLEEAALKVERDYESIPLVSPYHHVPQTISASSLHFKSELYYSVPGTDAVSAPGFAAIDELLQQCGIEAQEFGTIVHGFIEAIFNGVEPKLPSRISASLGSKNQKALIIAAQNLAEGFFNSALGQKALSADFCRTEYPILTAVERQGRRILVSGKIDLLFSGGEPSPFHGSAEYTGGSSIYVVDFKTDRDEDITCHVGQLAIYKRAAEDIFGKPTKCRLFYLRSGNEANLDEEISKINPEELVTAWEEERKYQRQAEREQN